jgi:CTP:molybdopterin cytidylyltransferase MocA
MRPDDNLIISHLDDTWRTAPAVHRLLGDHGTVADVASALERLARAGKIEAKHEAVMAPRYRDKAGPPVLCIDFYRKLQRRTPQHGDEGAGARHPIAKPSAGRRKPLGSNF